jgi:hypothetical protein
MTGSGGFGDELCTPEYSYTVQVDFKLLALSLNPAYAYTYYQCGGIYNGQIWTGHTDNRFNYRANGVINWSLTAAYAAYPNHRFGSCILAGGYIYFSARNLTTGNLDLGRLRWDSGTATYVIDFLSGAIPSGGLDNCFMVTAGSFLYIWPMNTKTIYRYML